MQNVQHKYMIEITASIVEGTAGKLAEMAT
jgi:hypothetical protein